MTTAASDPQIARRVKVIARAAGLPDWENFSGHSGRVGMARRMAQNGAPTHEIERQGRWKQGGGMVGRYTSLESAADKPSRTRQMKFLLNNWADSYPELRRRFCTFPCRR